MTGAIQENQPTNDSQPTITGTGEAGSLITLYDNGQEIGIVIVDGQGNWSYKPEHPAFRRQACSDRDRDRRKR
ncbi:Ig-like domain-containing protein [Citrobacter farmeri]